MFGANASPYQQPGEWQVSLSARNLVSNDHYNGTVEQVERQRLESYVNNTQNLYDIGLTRVLTRRVSVSVGVPFVNSTWALRDPAYPLPAPRREIPQNGKGIGDVTGRAWVFTPSTHPDWNVSAGGGIKFPTGNSRYQDRFISQIDRVEALHYVDQSVQPGDGGWGVIVEGQAFWRVKRAFLFASGSYLANPKDTNDTPSIIVWCLGLPTNTGQFGLDVNSVPDQFTDAHRRNGSRLERRQRVAVLADGGAEALRPVRRQPRMAAARHGDVRRARRRLAQGRHTVTFNLPIGYYFNRHRNPYTGNPGDATFPKQIFLSSYSLRLGARRAGPPATDQPNTPQVPSQPPGVPSGPTGSATPAPGGPAASSR